MDIPDMIDSARPILIAFGLKVLGAIAAYIIGRMLIGFASNLVMHAMERQKVEPTVIRYMGSIITVVLNITAMHGNVVAICRTDSRSSRRT
jgi:small conductance mechanosensitive channel